VRPATLSQLSLERLLSRPLPDVLKPDAPKVDRARCRSANQRDFFENRSRFVPLISSVAFKRIQKRLKRIQTGLTGDAALALAEETSGWAILVIVLTRLCRSPFWLIGIRIAGAGRPVVATDEDRR
jgi:hypothetical protein